MKNRVKLEGEELEAYKQKMEEERLEKERLEEERQDLEWVAIIRWIKKNYNVFNLKSIYNQHKPSSELVLIDVDLAHVFLFWPLKGINTKLSWL